MRLLGKLFVALVLLLSCAVPLNVYCEEDGRISVSEIYMSECKSDDFTLVFKLNGSQHLEQIKVVVIEEDNIFNIRLNANRSFDEAYSVKMSDYDVPIKENTRYKVRFEFTTSEEESLYFENTTYTITTPSSDSFSDTKDKFTGIYPLISNAKVDTNAGPLLSYNIEHGSLKTIGYGYLLYKDGTYLGCKHQDTDRYYDDLEVVFDLSLKFGEFSEGNYELRPYTIADKETVCFGKSVCFSVCSSEYLEERVKQFLNDPRWKDGAEWIDLSDPDGRNSYLNPEHRSWACCAAVDDFCFYMFAQYNYDGTKSLDVRSLRQYDSVYLEHTNSDGSITPHHLAILEVYDDGRLYTFDANNKRTYVSSERWTVDYQKGIFYLHRNGTVASEWKFIYCRHHPG